MKKKQRRSNPVAKNMEKFNRPATHKDRKKEHKKRGPKNPMEDYLA